MYLARIIWSHSSTGDVMTANSGRIVRQIVQRRPVLSLVVTKYHSEIFLTLLRM